MENAKKKVLSVPFYCLELPFSGPSSFNLAMSDLILGDKYLYGQTTACYFVFLELMVYSVGTFSLHMYIATKL